MVSESATCDFVVHVGTFFFYHFGYSFCSKIPASSFSHHSRLAIPDLWLPMKNFAHAVLACAVCMQASLRLSALCAIPFSYIGGRRSLFMTLALFLYSLGTRFSTPTCVLLQKSRSLRRPERSMVTFCGPLSGDIQRALTPPGTESPLKISLPLLLLPCYSYSSLATATRPSPLFLRIPSTPSKTS